MDTTLRSVSGPPVENGTARRIVLEPGQLSRPEKVWATSSTLIIGFHQAAPYSESFKIFYKVCLSGRAPIINPLPLALHAQRFTWPCGGPSLLLSTASSHCMAPSRNRAPCSAPR